jgi:hypothetical protein
VVGWDEPYGILGLSLPGLSTAYLIALTESLRLVDLEHREVVISRPEELGGQFKQLQKIINATAVSVGTRVVDTCAFDCGTKRPVRPAYYTVRRYASLLVEP